MGLADFFIGLIIIVSVGVALSSFSDAINAYRENALDTIPNINVVESVFLHLLMPIIWGSYILLSLMYLVLLRGGIGF
jgi:hypothetical protein